MFGVSLTIYDRLVKATESSESQHLLRALRPFVEDGSLPKALVVLILVPLFCAIVGKTETPGVKLKSRAHDYPMGVVHAIQLYGSLSTITFLRWTLKQSPFRVSAVIDYIASSYEPGAVPFIAIILAPLFCHMTYEALASPFLCASRLRHASDGYAAAAMTCWIALEIIGIAPVKTRIVTIGRVADESTARDEVATFCAFTACKCFLIASTSLISLFSSKQMIHALNQQHITFTEDSVEVNVYCSETLHQAPGCAIYQVYAVSEKTKNGKAD